MSKFVFIFSSSDHHKLLESTHTHEVEADNWEDAYYTAYALCPEKEGDILWYAAEIFDTGSYDITSLVESWIEEIFCSNVKECQLARYNEDFDIPF